MGKWISPNLSVAQVFQCLGHSNWTICNLLSQFCYCKFPIFISVRVRTADQGEPFLLRVIYVLRLFSPSKDGAVVGDLQKQRHLLTKNKSQFFSKVVQNSIKRKILNGILKSKLNGSLNASRPRAAAPPGLPPQARLIPIPRDFSGAWPCIS